MSTSPAPGPLSWSRIISTSTARHHSTKPFRPLKPGGWSSALNGTTLQSVAVGLIWRSLNSASYRPSASIAGFLTNKPSSGNRRLGARPQCQPHQGKLALHNPKCSYQTEAPLPTRRILMIAEEIGVSEGAVRTARKQSGSQDYEPVWEALACRFTPAGFSCSTAFSPLYWLQSLLRGESDVASGTVKWFNGQKGYGFIAPDTGGKDVFVHISAVEKAGLDGLPDGAKVTFDIVPNRGKESAENLRVK